MTPKCPDCKRDQDDCICASPASAPEVWKLVPVEPTGEMVDAGMRFMGTADKFRSMLAAAPTPPSIEDRKDAERYRWLRVALSDRSAKGRSHHFCSIKEGHPEELDAAIDAAMQEDKP